MMIYCYSTFIVNVTVHDSQYSWQFQLILPKYLYFALFQIMILQKKKKIIQLVYPPLYGSKDTTALKPHWEASASENSSSQST